MAITTSKLQKLIERNYYKLRHNNLLFEVVLNKVQECSEKSGMKLKNWIKATEFRNYFC